MKPNLLILNRAAGIPADGWYQIEVAGEHPASGGRVQVIDGKALESIVNRFRSDKEAAGDNWAGMLVDGDHLSHDEENSTEAFAWLQDLDIRNGQLFGKLDLTDLGEPAVRNKRFKFFSTEYDAADLEDLGGGRVRPLRLAGLAFTNRPNNRGGKPISNRAGDPGGEPTQASKPTKTMQSIAEKLGLSAEATEADILNAIAALQTKVGEMESKEKSAEAETVMNRFGARVPEAARPHWMAELIRNRETTEKLMETSFPEGAATTEGKTAIFNREKAQSPAPVETAEAKAGADAEKKAAAIRNRAHSIATERKLPFNQAFALAEAELR
jgi:hypothetical protein